MSWRDCRLGDVLTLQRGHDLPNTQRKDGEVPVVSSSGITGRHNVPKASAPGVVTGRYGTLGEVFYIEQDYWPLNTALYVKDFKGNQPRFIAYLLKNILGNYKSDKAAVPGVNRNVLHEMKVQVPEVHHQERIASILSAYDDLIENNRRRIQLLEQAARLLYKEWFVHLRFPGHEHVKIKDGVPEGWTVERLSDIATKIGSGATPRGGAAAYQTEGIALIRSQNIYDYRFEDAGLAYINEVQAEKLSTVTVEPSDILLNITGASVGRCCMVPERHLPARVNQHVMIIRIGPKQHSAQYVLHFINSHQQKQMLLSIAKAGGATREALTKDIVQNISVLMPSAHMLGQFEETAGRFFIQQQLLAAQNSKLVAARDLLLPRLMNGEVAA
jgi:type I restriction enzyme S subunit